MFMLVVSVKLNDDLLDEELFTLHETISILQSALELQISMKMPDLEYIILRTFD